MAINKKDKPFSYCITTNSPAPIEVLDLVIDELHSHREAAGVEEDDVRIQVEACEDHGMHLLKITMAEK